MSPSVDSISRPLPAAVVIGLGVEGLGVVRSLGRMGIPVLGVPERARDPGLRSRYCRPLRLRGDDSGGRSRMLSAVDLRDPALLEALCRRGDELGRPPLFAASEEALRFLSAERERLAPHFRFHLVEAPTLRRILSRSGALELAQELGIPVPSSSFPRRPEEIEAIPASEGEVHVCAAGFDGSSRPLALHTSRVLRRFPLDGGSPSLVESESASEIEALTLRLLQAIAFRGLGAAEFTRDRETGRLELTGFTPRLPRHNLLAADAGVNLPYLAYRDLLGLPPAAAVAGGAHPSPRGRRWLEFSRDAIAFREGRRLGGPGLRAWIASLLGARSFALFDRRDPHPFLHSTLVELRILATRARRWIWGALHASLRGGAGPRPDDLSPAGAFAHPPAAPAPEEPLRLLHTVNILGLAGMEYGVIKQVNRLDRGRFRPSIACLARRHESTRGLLSPDVPVHELHRREGRDYGVILRLARLLRRERIQVVHSHNWPTFFYTVAAAALARTPVVIHGEHGRETSRSPERLARFRRIIGLGVDRFTAVSADLAEELARESAIPSERVSCIPNGVDLERFHGAHDLAPLRAELALGPENPVALIVGRLRPVKGLPVLIRAFAAASREIPAARLVIVGDDGGDGMRSELERLAAELGARERVIFTGARRDIPELLSLARVFVNASSFEGMSNSILEAMASRRAVIATRVGGNPELVEEGKTGFLVPPGDPEALGAKLALLLAGAPLAERLGRAGRERVERRHSLEVMVSAYEDLYLEAWTRRSARAVGELRREMKLALSRGASWSGIIRARDRFGERGLAILTYHRVLPLRLAEEAPFQPMILPRDIFESQISHLARRYRVLHFSEAVTRLREGTLPPRAAAVTFDDGYADNYQHAWPILRKHGVPAIFFVVTGPVDRGESLWWDRLVDQTVWIVREGLLRPGDAARFPRGERAIVEALRSGSMAPVRGGEMLVRHLNPQLEERRTAVTRLLDEIAERKAAPPVRRMMTWEQLASLVQGGAEVGAHTVNHLHLDQAGAREARGEILESRRALERRLAVPARHFAYPRGLYRSETLSVLEECGIESAVTTRPGRNWRGTPTLELRRLDSGYCRLPGGFDPSIFDAELQGFFSGTRT